MSKKLTCIITDKSITVSDEYYQKKVNDFDSEEDLTNHYVSRQAKNLLKRGYKVKEIREMLKVTKTLKEVTEAQIKKILNGKDEDDLKTAEHFNVTKSDQDVADFVNRLKAQKSII